MYEVYLVQQGLYETDTNQNKIHPAKFRVNH
jgi:hypothetical protein